MNIILNRKNLDKYISNIKDTHILEEISYIYNKLEYLNNKLINKKYEVNKKNLINELSNKIKIKKYKENKNIMLEELVDTIKIKKYKDNKKNMLNELSNKIKERADIYDNIKKIEETYKNNLLTLEFLKKNYPEEYRFVFNENIF